jgi:hypothetical protein
VSELQAPSLPVGAPVDSPAEAALELLPHLPPAEALEAWDQAIRQCALLLRSTTPDAAWLAPMRTAAGRVRTLARRDADKAFYLLLQAATNDLDRYSAHHAILCALVAEACAQTLQWRADEIDSLFHAALTMNLAMSSAQDALARQAAPLSSEQRELVEQHAARGAELLAAAGVDDACWLEIVRLHHDAAGPTDAPGPRLARLLMRVDVYCAKLSRRATREPVPAALAARDACLDAQRQPDAIGSAILRTMGLYPPGSFVQLANGEIGVVVKRGVKAHSPRVAALRRPDGGFHQQPVLRDTSQLRLAVTRGMTLANVKVHANHVRILAL